MIDLTPNPPEVVAEVGDLMTWAHIEGWMNRDL